MVGKYDLGVSSKQYLDSKEESFFKGVNDFIENNLGSTLQKIIKGCVDLKSVYQPTPAKTLLGRAGQFAGMLVVESTQMLVRNAIRQPLKALYHIGGAAVSTGVGLWHKATGDNEKAKADFNVAKSHGYRCAKSLAICGAMAVGAATVAATFGGSLPFLPVVSTVGSMIAASASAYVASIVLSTAIVAVPAYLAYRSIKQTAQNAQRAIGEAMGMGGDVRPQRVGGESREQQPIGPDVQRQARAAAAVLGRNAQEGGGDNLVPSQSKPKRFFGLF